MIIKRPGDPRSYIKGGDANCPTHRGMSSSRGLPRAGRTVNEGRNAHSTHPRCKVCKEPMAQFWDNNTVLHFCIELGCKEYGVRV